MAVGQRDNSDKRRVGFLEYNSNGVTKEDRVVITVMSSSFDFSYSLVLPVIPGNNTTEGSLPVIFSLFSNDKKPWEFTQLKYFIRFLQHAAAVLPEPLDMLMNATLRQDSASASVMWQDGIVVTVKSASSTCSQALDVKGNAI